MSISGAKEYRLLHKKDGTYVLQTKKDWYAYDEETNSPQHGFYWEDLETAEEEDGQRVNQTPTEE